MLALTALSLSYQLAAPLHRQHALRASQPSMEYRLNNYILPGPLQALNNQVLIKLRKTDDMTTGGLFVPSAETEKPLEGVVVAAGPGVVHPDTGKLMPTGVVVGDVVLMSDFMGEKVDYCGEKHIFISSNDVLGVFDGGDVSAGSFRPLEDKLLVATAEAATETTTGIALAGIEDDDESQGEVIAAGPGKTSSNGQVTPPTVAVGQSVMYKARTGAEAIIGDRKYKVVPESDCLAKW